MLRYLPSGYDFWFPPFTDASPDGLLAAGGDLSIPRLLVAYSQGIFPWYGENSPILWWHLPERSILHPDSLHIPRSLRRVINSQRFSVSVDTAFHEVISACAETPRPGQTGTWILPEMREAYTVLHKAGYAHSVEVWEEGVLAGGLYGVALDRVFFGESMFYQRTDASKVAFVWLTRYLAERRFSLIDCQQVTENTERFGAMAVSRDIFMMHLNNALDIKKGFDKWADPWCLPENFFPL